jgi:hypothetical protein
MGRPHPKADEKFVRLARQQFEEELTQATKVLRELEESSEMLPEKVERIVGITIDRLVGAPAPFVLALAGMKRPSKEIADSLRNLCTEVTRLQREAEDKPLN